MSLPNGYTRLLYIQSDGTQYINTGFIPNQDTRVVCDVAYNTPSESGSHYLLGARQSNGVLTYGINAYDGIYQTMYNNETTDMGSGIAARFTIDKNKNVTTINGTSYTQSYASFSCPGSMFLFAMNNNGAVYARSTATLYSCKIYDNGTLVRDFIPAKNTSGVVGLWDDVNSTFYADAAGGGFADPSAPVGDHNTLIGGAACDIEGGTVLIGGTAYEIEKGMAMVNGTAQEISFGKRYLVTITVLDNDKRPSTFIVTVTIDGTTYNQAATVEVKEGTVIHCYAYVGSMSASGHTAYNRVYLNGEMIVNTKGNVAAEYDYTVNGNASITLDKSISNAAHVKITEE